MIKMGIHLDKPSLNKGRIKQQKINAEPASGCIIIKKVGKITIRKIIPKCLFLLSLNKKMLYPDKYLPIAKRVPNLASSDG